MSGLIPLAFWAFSQGVLTAISPCPMAVTVAAISYIGSQVGSKRRVLSAGLLYCTGQAIAYTVIAMIVAYTALSATRLSSLLQTSAHLLIGPVLIVAGLLVLNWLQIPLGGSIVGRRWQALVERSGTLAAFPLGIVLALSFCPTTAALFFGAVIPAIQARSLLVLPLSYGLGATLPVVVFCLIATADLPALSKFFDSTTAWRQRIQTVAASLLILTGIYLSLKDVYQLF